MFFFIFHPYLYWKLVQDLHNFIFFFLKFLFLRLLWDLLILLIDKLQYMNDYSVEDVEKQWCWLTPSLSLLLFMFIFLFAWTFFDF